MPLYTHTKAYISGKQLALLHCIPHRDYELGASTAHDPNASSLLLPMTAFRVKI